MEVMYVDSFNSKLTIAKDRTSLKINAPYTPYLYRLKELAEKAEKILFFADFTYRGKIVYDIGLDKFAVTMTTTKKKINLIYIEED